MPTLGPDAAAAGDAALRPRGARAAGRGRRLHRPLDGRDQRPRRVHAAGAGGRLDRPRPRLGTGVVGVFQRGPALLAQQAAALADASRGRFVLGIGASSDRIVEGWNEIPFERPLSKVSETVDFLRPALAGERTPTGFKLELRPADRCRSCSPPCAARCCGSPSRRRRAPSRTSSRSRGCPRSSAQLDGAPDGFELLCRFFCLAGEREQVEPLARFMFASYVDGPGLRGLLPLARPRRRDRRDVRGLGAPRTASARPRRRRGT